MKYRVWAEINLANMESNCRYLAKTFGGADRLMIVCKANAYGHGIKFALEVAKRVGIKRLGVGDSHEALELRELGWNHQILVLGSLIDEEILSIIENDVAIAVHSLEKTQFLDDLTRQLKKPLEIHLKVDTGMGRFGTGEEKVESIVNILRSSPHLKWRGLMTHFACPEDSQKNTAQLKRFNKTTEKISPLPENVAVHAAGTRTGLNCPESHFDFVRSGLGVYGLLEHPRLKPVLSLYSQIIFIKDLPEGSQVGYEGEFACSRPTRLAILPMGYSDGLPFSFGNRAYVLIRGQKAPIIGRVSMDYTTVDTTDIPHVQVGDRVILIGQDENEKLQVNDWAKWSQTTPYEITCLLGNRVHRVAAD